MMTRRAQYIWFNGEIVPWEDAKIHVRTECAMRGANVFEGIRAYWSEAEEQLHLFKAQQHLERLDRSMKIMRMSITYTRDDLISACVALLKKNRFREDIHLRPCVYFGEGAFSAFSPEEILTGTVVAGVPMPSRLDLEEGIACCVSSWVRISDDTIPPRIKAGANYQNSRLAAVEARVNGYDNAILLNRQGKVAEGTNACVFIVRDGVPVTPGVTDGILESITRATLIELFQVELGLTVVEREVDRTELYVAEEVFFCGSGAEILPIGSVDRYLVGGGKVGPMTRRIRAVYSDVVRGRNPKYAGWLLPVYRR
jgi:branched-chain amino acid aminotransferase